MKFLLLLKLILNALQLLVSKNIFCSFVVGLRCFFNIGLVYAIVFGFSGCSQYQKTIKWPNNNLTAIILSYDDALLSQLENAVPFLHKYKFTASFYPILSSSSFAVNFDRWSDLASQSFEFGNHTVFHPCRASLPNRSWVAKEKNLDIIEPESIIAEVNFSNRFLYSLDRQKLRTFSPPCGDRLAKGVDYISVVKKNFVAVKGESIEDEFLIRLIPDNIDDASFLIDFVEKNEKPGIAIDIVFHGIGGDYLSVSKEAHSDFLKFLYENSDRFRVDSYLNIMSAYIDREGYVR